MPSDLDLWNTWHYSPVHFPPEEFERWRNGEKVDLDRVKKAKKQLEEIKVRDRRKEGLR